MGSHFWGILSLTLSATNGLFRLTLKSTHLVNGLRLEKGMSVEVASPGSNPLISNGGKEVIAAYQRVYGLDLSKAKEYLSSAYFEVKKVN